jgi:hypothetical protein
MVPLLVTRPGQVLGNMILGYTKIIIIVIKCNLSCEHLSMLGASGFRKCRGKRGRRHGRY